MATIKGKERPAVQVRVRPGNTIPVGHEAVEIEVSADDTGDIQRRVYRFDTSGFGHMESRTVSQERGSLLPVRVQWKLSDLGPGQYLLGVTMEDHLSDGEVHQSSATVVLEVTGAEGARGGGGGEAGRGGGMARPGPIPIPLPVTLTRTRRVPTEDEILWAVIRNSTENLSFNNYLAFMDDLFFGEGKEVDLDRSGARRSLVEGTDLDRRRERMYKSSDLRLPFPGVEPYRAIKAATEAFVLGTCGVHLPLSSGIIAEVARRLEFDAAGAGAEVPRERVLARAWEAYLDEVNRIPGTNTTARALPYLGIIRRKLGEVPVLGRARDDDDEVLFGIAQRKLVHPCMIELIWSYWHEEGMLVQTLNAVSNRFQNRSLRDRDPLANLEIDPLRPLNNILWGYIQDEQHQLSIKRRAFEYEHQYGMSLYGKAVGALRPAERRSKFLEAFHNLLYQAHVFYRQDDDTTIIADAFPVLNSIKETHYLLAQGAHNQFGDLPSTARQEMLIQQWLLARPEMREFLGGRVMVPYPEAWMDRVDAMKTLQGWTDVSAVHFHDLAVFGERILLSLRLGAWSLAHDQAQAANWVRAFRSDIQGYAHAYRVVTGVDLSADIMDVRQAQARYAPPSLHLQQRLAQQRR